MILIWFWKFKVAKFIKIRKERAEYCKELGIKEQIPSGDIDVESVLSELKEKTNSIEKRVISLEILGLMYSDGEYDSSEKEFVDELVNKFEITKDELEKIDKLLNEYSEVYKKMVSEIFRK